MTYKEAKKIKPGDLVSDVNTRNQMDVLSVEEDACGKDLFFTCIHGSIISTYHHRCVQRVEPLNKQEGSPSNK